MHTRRITFALVTLLSLVLTLVVPVAPIASVWAETPPPPPSRDSTADWAGPQPRLPRLPESAGDPTATKSEQNIIPQGNCNIPDKGMYTTSVFSASDGLRPDDIYSMSSLCDPTNVIRLTTHPADDYLPRFSPDSHLIVFVSTRDGNPEIYSMNLDGSAQARLTRYSGGDSMPAISPDGKQIVFASDRGNGSADIYVMNTDGAGIRRLTSSTANDLYPDWSPDGKQIAFVRRSSDNLSGALYVMSANGSNQHPITSYRYALARPVWSPSGDYLAFTFDSNESIYSKGDGQLEIGMVYSSGGTITEIPIFVYGDIDLHMGSWLPDDEGIVYTASVFIYYNKQWWLKESNLRMFNLESNESREINDWSYVFDPYSHSMDDTPPQLTFAYSSLPEYVRADFRLPFTATDNLAGIYQIELQSYSESYLGWHSIQTYYPGSKLAYTEEFHIFASPEKLYLRAVATDAANNTAIGEPVELWTNAYNHIDNFLVTDVRGLPVPAVTVSLDPTALNTPVTGSDGQAAAYIGRGTGMNAAYHHPEFGSPPVHKVPDTNGKDLSFVTVLPGLDNLITNSFFNAGQGSLYGWQTGGSLPITTPYYYSPTGIGNAANLGPCNNQGKACAAGEATLSQAINLEDEMYQPTLSFFYSAYTYTAQTSPQSSLQVTFTPQGGQAVTLTEQAVTASSSVAHAWVDMSPYVGQTGQLTFRLKQAGNELPAYVTLEQITLSSANVPYIASAGPLSILAAEAAGTWIDLDGGNFAPTAQVFLGNREITGFERTGSTHIRFQLPADIAAGWYDLRIVNPLGAEAHTARKLYIGYYLYQPLLMR